MFTVALIGADGAGKTTVARLLEKDKSLRLKYLYMGVSYRSGEQLLPTTRLAWALKRRTGRADEYGGPPDPSRRKRPRGALRRAMHGAKELMIVANRMAEEGAHLLQARSYLRQGYVVVFDRHYYTDYYAHDIADAPGRPLARRLHGYFLSHFFPRPDLTILLDAPAETLFARKGEGSVQLLELRRREYWRLAGQVPHFAVVDASRPLEEVSADVHCLVREFHRGAWVLPERYRPAAAAVGKETDGLAI
jgi:thymidylate kinase